MMADRYQSEAGRMLLAGLFLAGSLLMSGSRAGAEPVFRPLLATHDMTSLLEHDGVVYGGLDAGGLVISPADDPAGFRRWYGGAELGGNEVTDLAWTGRYLWVATADGGLTRIGDPDGTPDFRQYTSNLGSLNVTAVAGTIIGESERVFYGMSAGGIGRIVDGLSGNIYTAEQDGLIDNDINALAFYHDDLFIATPSGISRFAGNVFTTVNEGLPAGGVADLVATGEDQLLAGTPEGVFLWDAELETWSELGDFGTSVDDVAWGPAGVYALKTSGGPVLRRWDGATWATVGTGQGRISALAVGQEVWFAGPWTRPGGGSTTAYLGHVPTGQSPTTVILESSLVRNAEGVTFDKQGGAWVGSYVADAVSGLDTDGSWSHISSLAADSDYDHGLFNRSSNILSMTSDLQGKVWISQYTTGLIRHDPDTGRDSYFKPDDSGMSGAFILDMVVHPDGPLITTHDIAWIENRVYPEKVDVLLDTDHGEDPGQWLTLPVDEGGITSTNRIWSALVQRRDVVWFAAEDYGLLRWDINGDAAGPDDPLTWGDFSDDRWDGPLTFYSGSGNDPKKVKGLALAPDGSIWAGGNGLVRFSYDATTRQATVLETYGEKVGNFLPGLVSGLVSDVVVDGNGDAWVSSTAGLNRIGTHGGQTTVEAWIDLPNYLANSNYGLLYSTGVIAPLPGTIYRDLAVSPDGRQVLLSADKGAVLIDVGSATGGAAAQGDLAGVYCYPNPWHAAGGGDVVKLGGLPLEDDGAGGLRAEVYNLEGELVFRNTGVLPDQGFWDGRNRFGDAVATGMYVVRVSWSGQTVAVPLSVVR